MFCNTVINTLQAQPYIDSSYKKSAKTILLKPTTDFDQRFSFIDKQGVNIWGYRIGVVVKDAYKVGIGGYFLNQDTTVVRTNRQGLVLSKLQRKLYFGTIYYEPYLFRKPLIEMSLVFELGYGVALLDSSNLNRQGRFINKEEKQAFVPAGVGISYNFKIPDIKGLHFLTYIGINAMIGLRKTIFESDLKYNFDGWYWSIGSAIFIDKIFSDAKLRKIKKQQRLQSKTTP